MVHRGSLIVGHVLFVFYLVLAYATPIFPVVLSVLGLPQAAEELLVALVSLVCLTSIVWWMFLDDSDECAGRALVKRTGALLCLTFAVLAVAVAFVGFSSFVVATDENVATWLMAGLLGVVGFMALVRAGTLLSQEAQRMQPGVNPERTSIDVLALGASVAFVLVVAAVIALISTTQGALAIGGAMLMNVLVVLALIWLLVREDLSLVLHARGGDRRG